MIWIRRLGAFVALLGFWAGIVLIVWGIEALS